MQYVSEAITKTLEVKQSKFITHLVPYSMYESHLEYLKQEHPKARHFVVASRYINEFDQVVEHSSDDGEPKGTSGKPSLAVLAGSELINSAVIVVRYFGGTRLGTGGLVRAYSQACHNVIEIATLKPYIKRLRYQFIIEYTDISLIEYHLQEFKIEIQNKAFDEKGACFKVLSTKEFWAEFYAKFDRKLTLIV